jgi:hypothetical protein
MSNLKLVYANPIGIDSSNIYEYEFFFSETPEIVWGNNWHIQCPASCKDVLPEDTSYSLIKHLKTDKKLFCAQENTCFSLQDMIDGIIPVCFEDINGLDDYPEPYRLVLPFGLDYDEVVEQLGGLDLVFEDGDFMHKNEQNDENDETNNDGSDNNDDDDWDDDRYPLDLKF